MKSLKALTILVLLFSFGAAQANAGERSSMAGRFSKKKSSLPWSVSLSYNGNTDLLSKADRSYFHSLTLAPSYKINESWSAGAFGSYSYETIDGEIIREKDDYDRDGSSGRPVTGDIGLSLSYTIPLSGKLVSQNTLTETLPTSTTSKYEGYKSIVGLSSTIPFPFSKYDLTFSNTLGLTYIFNTFLDSQTTLTPNPEWVAMYSLGLSYSISKIWSVGAGGSARTVRFLDGSNKFKVGNSVYTGIKIKNWSSRISYLNDDPSGSGNTNLDSTQVLRIDEYRQLVGWDLSCSF